MKNLVKGRVFPSRFVVYKPSQKPSNDMCLGENHFLSTKFWKLFVMAGMTWTGLAWRTRGFTTCTILRGRPTNLIKFLDDLGIAYTEDVSESGFQYYLNISSRKKNLELIDELYKKFYREYNAELKLANKKVA